jgi:signal transduction histidine kinase/CheY-like chemotaxis protein
MPTGRDADLVRSTLVSVNISADVYTNSVELRVGIAEGAGAILIAEEAVEANELEQLVEALESQPVWSDLPVIIFSSHSRNAEMLIQKLGGRINVTIVERPIRITMLISAVRGALRARQRQYQTRDLLAQLEQADRQKDLFLATLSHELRTPLNSILGWTQIVRTKTLKEVEVDRAMEVIERNARGQAEMISDILFVSRIITGKLEIKREPINISDVVASVADMIKPSADAKSLTLIVDIDEYEPVPIEGDAERLSQVFLNLLTNSVKFTPDGGIVSIGLKVVHSNVEVEVRDTGEGINPKFLPHVFERFRQADSTYARSIGGLGLGLAIVRHLVELHGGTVTAESEGSDRGSVFRVTLPVADDRRFMPSQNANQVAVLSEVENSKLKGLRVLIVEDDKDSRDMLEMALKLYEIKVESVESARDGFTKLKQDRPDLLVSDIGLPGEDGYDLIKKVRALPARDGGRTPAIALTGYVSIQDRNLALDAGYQDHIAKPVNANDLVRLFLTLVDSSKPNGTAA